MEPMSDVCVCAGLKFSQYVFCTQSHSHASRLGLDEEVGGAVMVQLLIGGRDKTMETERRMI